MKNAIVLIMLAVLLLAGCGVSSTTSNFSGDASTGGAIQTVEKIEIGMQLHQVEAIMGRPADGAEYTSDGTAYYTWNGADGCPTKIVMKDDKVLRRVTCAY